MSHDSACFCQSGKNFSRCCSPFLNLDALPETSEQLMRSRYSAFVTENEPYLLSTWHPDNRPTAVQFDPQCKWLGLKVKRCKAGQASDQIGWVEFVARFKIVGKAERIEELSYFIKQDGKWLYACAENRVWDELA